MESVPSHDESFHHHALLLPVQHPHLSLTPAGTIQLLLDDPQTTYHPTSILSFRRVKNLPLQEFCRRIRDPKSGFVRLDRTVWHGRTYRNCFVAKEAVDWLCDNNYCKTREDAVTICTYLRIVGLIHHVAGVKEFGDSSTLFFRFTGETNEPKPEPEAPRDVPVGLLDVDLLELLVRQLWKEPSLNKEASDFTFSGSDLVTCMIEQGICNTRAAGLFLGQQLMENKLLVHPERLSDFRDSSKRFRFALDDIDMLVERFCGNKLVYRQLLEEQFALEKKSAELHTEPEEVIISMPEPDQVNTIQRLFNIEQLEWAARIHKAFHGCHDLRELHLDTEPHLRLAMVLRLLANDTDRVSKQDLHECIKLPSLEMGLHLEDSAFWEMANVLWHTEWKQSEDVVHPEDLEEQLWEHRDTSERLANMIITNERHLARHVTGLVPNSHVAQNQENGSDLEFENSDVSFSSDSEDEHDEPEFMKELVAAAQERQVLTEDIQTLDPIGWRRRLATWISLNRRMCLFFTVLGALNVALAVAGFAVYAYDPKYEAGREAYGATLIIAKSASFTIYLNAPLVLLMMCRMLLTSWSKIPGIIGRMSPIDLHTLLHIVCFSLMMLFAGVHTVAHFISFSYPIFYTTLAGVTGVVMWICMIVMLATALKRVRRKRFELFWFTHHLFILFYLCLILHGFQMLIAFPLVWIFLLPVIVAYVVQRVRRPLWSTFKLREKELTIEPGNVLKLTFPKPSDWNYTSGQYIFLNWENAPERAARLEYHPFTISSCPMEPTVTVHIRSAGDWTRALFSAVKANSHPIELRFDGAYGAPTQLHRVQAFKRIVLVAAGVGVTPMASVLRTIHLCKRDGKCKIKKLYFFWLNRDIGPFQWFSDEIRELEADSPPGFFTNATYVTSLTNPHDFRHVLLNQAVWAFNRHKKHSPITGLHTPVHWGRPSWQRVFQILKSENLGKKIGVFFCGPSVIASDLQEQCFLHSDTQTKFRFAKEHF